MRRISVDRVRPRPPPGYTGATMRPPPPPPTLVLLVDGRPAAPVEVASAHLARARGLLGRRGLRGALVLPGTRSVHTVGMRFPIDVALCTGDLAVVAVRTLPPGRLVLPRRRVRVVVEAEAGSFERWGLAPGSQLALRS
jgi:uncharacterized membrane protein (UPF0127 family)